MKIWRAKLVLIMNDKDEYVTRFEFKLTGDNFQQNPNYPEWNSRKGWICTTVPFDIKISEQYSICATQGFDRELTEDELKDVKLKMKDEIMKYLYNKQLKIAQEYNSKLHAIINMKI